MKTVLVTGSTGTIGEAVARYFHERGYFVYLHFRSDEKKANELKSELKNSRTISFDILNKEEVFAKLENLNIDVLVNNAGITKDKLFFWMEDSDWLDVINTSINGTYNVTKAVIKKMIINKSGSIVNISSVSGLIGNQGQTNYSTAKGAIISFTKALCMEVGRYNIRVNAVAPGLIESNMTKDLDLKNIIKDIPLKRIGKPQEVAECVFFLGDKASHVSGEILNISGGMVR